MQMYSSYLKEKRRTVSQHKKHPLNKVTLNRHWSRDRQRNRANLTAYQCACPYKNSYVLLMTDPRVFQDIAFDSHSTLI